MVHNVAADEKIQRLFYKPTAGCRNLFFDSVKIWELEGCDLLFLIFVWTRAAAFWVRVVSAEDKCMDESFQVFFVLDVFSVWLLKVRSQSVKWKNTPITLEWVCQLLCVEELRGQRKRISKTQTNLRHRWAAGADKTTKTQKARVTFRQQHRKKPTSNCRNTLQIQTTRTKHRNALKTYCTCTNIYIYIHRTRIYQCV